MGPDPVTGVLRRRETHRHGRGSHGDGAKTRVMGRSHTDPPEPEGQKDPPLEPLEGTQPCQFDFQVLVSRNGKKQIFVFLRSPD